MLRSWRVHKFTEEMEQKPTTTTSGYADSASAYRASTAAAVRAVLTANKDGVLLRSVRL